MNTETHIGLELNKLESAISLMAWNIVDSLIEQETEKLRNQLDLKRPITTPISPRIRKLRTKLLLDSKKGVWYRGQSYYKVLGPGDEPDTYVLRNMLNRTVIVSTLSTLASRWKHMV